MTYIDSDGVLANFDDYLTEYLGHPASVEEARKVMVEDYKNSFLVSRTLPHSAFYFDMLVNDPNCYVLTALSKAEHLEPCCTDVPVEEVLRTHRENKYTWFERRGIPRNKVIIVDHASEKLKYCKPGDVLYDDRKKTIQEWNELGGIGIHIKNKYWDA